MKHWIKKPLPALVCNLLLVYVAFSLTRLAFVWCNRGLFAEHLSVGYFLQLLAAGLRFDTTAILYLNCWMILGFLLPCHPKEGWPRYYGVQRVLFMVVNAIGLVANLCDCAYFPFTGRRTTWNVLQEFGGEGNLASILLHESLPYWYLFLLGALLIWMLWRCFVTPARQRFVSTPQLGFYYVSQVVTFILAAVLTVGGIRGGFTTAVRPITISNANQYVRHSVDTGIVLNTPFSIMRTIGKKAFVEVHYMPMDEAEQIYSPVHVPADSVEFVPKNVVVMILESFSRQAMARGRMPFVDSLAHVGRSFEYSYATGRKSIDAMPSALSSIPSMVEPFFLTPSSLNELSGLAGELSRHKGYRSAFFHGADNGSMGFLAFSVASGFQEYYGRTEYNQDPRYHGDADFDGTWAVWDEEFLQYYCDKMNDIEEPFITSVFTATSHPPYAIPERYKDVYTPTTPPIFAGISYSDHAVRLFFEKASQQPWFQNTLFVLTADHTSESIDPEFLTDLGCFRIPIVFYAPGMPELTGVDSTRIVSQPDIMPTVLGLLGYDEPYVAFGRDVLHCDADETFAFNYHPTSGYFQLIYGDWMLQFDGQQLVHAYRFKDDPLLSRDLREQCPEGHLQLLKSFIQQYMYRMNNNQLVLRKDE